MAWQAPGNRALPETETEIDLKKLIDGHPFAKGIAVIIANQNSRKFSDQLDGVLNDCQALSTTLSSLRYVTIHLVNRGKREIIDCIKALFTQYPVYGENDLRYRRIIVSFAGHGDDQDFIHCKDGEIDVKKDIISPLLPKKCPRLRSIPKLFFIDACRGNVEDRPVPRGGSEHVYSRVSGEANYLLVRSTLPSMKAFETGNDLGGYWTQCFVLELQNPNNRGRDIGYILIEVNRNVNMCFNIPKYDVIQQAIAENTLLEHVFFLDEASELMKAAEMVRTREQTLPSNFYRYNSPIQRGGPSLGDLPSQPDPSPVTPSQASVVTAGPSTPAQEPKTPMKLLEEALIEKGETKPNIEYDYKEDRRGYRATAYLPIVGYVQGEACRTKLEAQKSVANIALTSLKQD